VEALLMAVDLGEIHAELQELITRCKPGSRRWKKLTLRKRESVK
jgi:hypothetical protein